MKTKNILLIIAFASVLASCGKNSGKADAYGNFEADETIISAEVSGKLLEFSVKEGDILKTGDFVALVDTMQLHFQKRQLMSKRGAVESNHGNIVAQVAVVEEQVTTLKKEKDRVEKLIASGAATGKQMDDINGQLNILYKQKESIKAQNSSLFSETDAIAQNIAQIEDMLNRAKIVNPINGTVLEKYVNQHEIVSAGKPLYKIADLDQIILRAYISGSQLSEIKIGQKVRVEIDKNEDENYSYEGTIIWVASESEFTPKLIQTKEERVNLVYAIKISVKNDGRIKIGMPGEVFFNN
jgi:HlyD family secretion protein